MLPKFVKNNCEAICFSEVPFSLPSSNLENTSFNVSQKPLNH